jgi:DNA-binding LacI/PurR family transcriptional regulator
MIDPGPASSLARPVARDRLAGHLEGLGSRARPLCWEAPESHREAGRVAARQMLAARPDLTAFLAASDELALGVIAELEQLGRRVPDDVSVVGFDGIPEAASGPVPLTTVEQALFERGGDAGHALLALIAGERPPRRRARPVELVVRASSGPAQ